MKQNFTVWRAALDGVEAFLSVGGHRAAFERPQPNSAATRSAIIGSSAYLAGSGQAERTDDLRDHACLRFRRSSGALALWSLTAARSRLPHPAPSSLTPLPPSLARPPKAFVDHVQSRLPIVKPDRAKTP